MEISYCFCCFIIPFIDIPFSFRGKLQVKDDVEQELHEQENLLAKYTVYSSVVNDKFMNMIDEKLKKTVILHLAIWWKLLPRTTNPQ